MGMFNKYGFKYELIQGLNLKHNYNFILGKSPDFSSFTIIFLNFYEHGCKKIQNFVCNF